MVAAIITICGYGSVQAEDYILSFENQNAEIPSGLSRKNTTDLSRKSLSLLRHTRVASHSHHVTKANSLQEAQLQAKIKGASHVQLDKRIYHQGISNDPLLKEQWNLDGLETSLGGANFRNAWDQTKGNDELVIAIIDTGALLNHNDLDGRWLPGYDFISNPLTANDGDGRDPDAFDTGDWINQSDINSGMFNTSCPVVNSSWHGTIVAGIIGAIADNQHGISGATWQTKLLPVRVMGKCGGQMSDVIDAIRWSAGLKIPGLPLNPYPADIINLSFAAPGRCSAAEQSAIDDAVATGALVIASAGNGGNDHIADDLNAFPLTPASCSDVFTVGAVTRLGTTAPYSNYGYEIDIYAPGGDFTHNGILATADHGTTIPLSDNAVVQFSGTSAATPHVSAAAALLMAQEPELSLNQIKNRLIDTSRPFSQQKCITGGCYSGILDADSALKNTALDTLEIEAARSLLDANMTTQSRNGGNGSLGVMLLFSLLFSAAVRQRKPCYSPRQHDKKYVK